MQNDFILDEETLAKVNRFTRAAVTAEEIYTFPVILCDNEVDRDGERFSLEALSKLAELFVGRTGIFDHNAKGENQTARIFDCEVKTDEARTTSAGESYAYLCGKAYMMRTSKNADLIAEIDGGIKKEVSVSCAVKKKLCSICGSDMNENPCGHVKGVSYGGKVCCHILDEPTDAYEWSFVAVPAQVGAGVSKTFSECESDEIGRLEKKLSEQRRAAENAVKDSQRAADMLKREIISLSFLCKPIMAVETVCALTEKLSFDELLGLYGTLKRQAEQSEGGCMLAKAETGVKSDSNSDFCMKSRD